MFHSYLSNYYNFITLLIFPNYLNPLFISPLSPGDLTVENLKEHENNTEMISYNILLILCFDNAKVLYPIKTTIINLAL